MSGVTHLIGNDEEMARRLADATDTRAAMMIATSTAATTSAKPVTLADIRRAVDQIKNLPPLLPKHLDSRPLELTQAEYDHFLEEVAPLLTHAAEPGAKDQFGGVPIVVLADHIVYARRLARKHGLLPLHDAALWPMPQFIDPDYFEKDAARRGFTLY